MEKNINSSEIIFNNILTITIGDPSNAVLDENDNFIVYKIDKNLDDYNFSKYLNSSSNINPSSN